MASHGSPGGGPGHGQGHGHGRHVILGDRSPAKPWKMAVLPRASHNRSGQCRGCKVPLICTLAGKVCFLI